MLWAAATRKALIVTGVIALALLAFRLWDRLGPSFLISAGIPVVAVLGALGAAAVGRARRRAMIVRRLRP